MKKMYKEPNIFVLDFAEEPYCTDENMNVSSKGDSMDNALSKDRSGDNLIPSISMDNDDDW